MNIFLHRFAVLLVLVALVVTTVPLSVLAEEVTVSPSAEQGGDGADSTGAADGIDGADGTTGDAGDAGAEGAAAEEPPVVQVTVENDIGGVDDAEEPPTEEATGGQNESSTTTTTIVTGDATAAADLTTDANNNNITSELGTTTPGDLDEYNFHATGTNEVAVENDGTVDALTGENIAASTNELAYIETGDAIAVLNIANILNTNVVNSSGFIQLINRLIEEGASLDLRGLFFPDGYAADGTCSLVSCHAEDITYTVAQDNTAGIVNDAELDAVSGANAASGTAAVVNTGDAYATANLLNIANTNIIDSNYLILALNALGSIAGDLVLPSGESFFSFFSRPNGLSQVESDEEGVLNVLENVNDALVDNDLVTTAESGLNQATTTGNDTLVITGDANADSNIVNEINKNLFGGDSLYVMIRIHGEWNGSVWGLPDGLAWERTPDGVLIYSEDSEIAPSQIVAIDVDSYTANFANKNDITIDNTMDLNALSGANAIEGYTGAITTGDAYAGANVVNIANTNVIGRNWVTATLNIFGDLTGDISFGRPDLWIGGQVRSADNPVGPGSKLTYTYTIKNNGDLKATNVEFVQELTSAYTNYASGDDVERGSVRREPLGTVRPGESIEVTYDAYVADDIDVGTTNIDALAMLTSDEPDNSENDNEETLTIVAERSAPSSGGSGGGGGGGDDDDRNGSRNSGRVLGSRIDREKDAIDVDGPPALQIIKTSSEDDAHIIKAGTVVEYTIIVRNNGGIAYDGRIVDTLTSPTGSVMNAQSWDLGDILPGERINLSYEIKYDENTPSGEYQNIARLFANEKDNDPTTDLVVHPAAHTLTIDGKALAVGNVEVLGVIPTGNGMSVALVTWETNKPSDGQMFFSPQRAASPYNPLAPNYGYERATFHFTSPTTKHYALVPDLKDGVAYSYLIRSAGDGHVTFGGDYELLTPGAVSARPAPVVAQAPATGAE